MIRFILIFLCVIVGQLDNLLADDVQADDLSYEADVRPILKAHCFQCHGERSQVEAKLDLRLRRFIAKGGESGPAIVPGDAAKSLLIQRVTSGEMPPSEEQSLSKSDIGKLTRWVNSGAKTARKEPEALDASYFTEEERNWWAFRPINRPEPPHTKFDVATPIDQFLLHGLSQMPVDATEQGAFDFSTRASLHILIRRLYLDMLGVLPSSDQVAEFERSNDPMAWSKLVDQVLASPRYGERWGRHWLDAAGYADSEGYTDEDKVREHAWRYRDYVIRSLNSDKPYSDFLIEQIAGDELVGWPNAKLSPDVIEKLAATGFLRMAPDGTASSGIDQSVARNQVIADTMQILGTAVMGVTIHCAQCHDHRYDPIPQTDYYRLRAIFEPAFDWKNWRTPPNRQVSLYTDQDKQRRTEIEAKAKEVEAKRKKRVAFYIDKTLEHELLMVEETKQNPLREAYKTPANKRTAEQKKLLDDHVNIGRLTEGSLYLYDRRREARAKDLDELRATKLAAHIERIKQAALKTINDKSVRKELLAAASIEESKRTDAQKQLVEQYPAVLANSENLKEFDKEAAAEVNAYETAAAEIRKFRIRTELQELADEVKAIKKDIPKEYFLRVLSERPNKVPATFVFHRGDHQQPKEKVSPRGLGVLGGEVLDGTLKSPPGEKLETTGRRLRFAQYLASGRHPLVARVLVNRLWAHHFGKGICSTTGDFGYLGNRPTHPQLLDWLAAEFIESGWSIKHIHRLILTSRVYQQSAIGSRQVVNADPENRFLGRWPMRRLESEIVRDSILAVVGDLNQKMYGQPVPVMEDEVGQIILGIESLDGERKPTKPLPLHGEEFRRCVYVQVRRTRPLGVLEGFDVAEAAPNCTERPSSNVAPQALMLMNSDFILRMSNRMAKRLVAESPGDARAQLTEAWKRAYGVAPSDYNLDQATSFIELQTRSFIDKKRPEEDAHKAALASFCQALLGSNRFLYIE